jgi:hypothetical protein
VAARVGKPRPIRRRSWSWCIYCTVLLGARSACRVRPPYISVVESEPPATHHIALYLLFPLPFLFLLLLFCSGGYLVPWSFVRCFCPPFLWHARGSFFFIFFFLFLSVNE